jgi:hypothetical protein
MMRSLVLLVATRARVLVLPRQDHGSTVDPVEGFGGDGRALGADGSTDGHEEALQCVSAGGGAVCGFARIPKSRR